MKQKISVKIRAINFNLLTVQVMSNASRQFERGETLLLEYDDFQKPRTLSQNAFFHLCLSRMTPFFKELDPTMTESGLKHWLKQQFLTSTVEREQNGFVFAIPVTKPTSTLGKGEFLEFFSQCVDFFRDYWAPIDAFLDEYEEIMKNICEKA